jgi:hypothetical protein
VQEADDPFPVYMRGIYFDGIDNYLKLENVVLNASYTIEFWIKSGQISTPHTFFNVKGGSPNFLQVGANDLN